MQSIDNSQLTKEEMVLEYYKQGFSINKLAKMTDTPVVKVMEILRKSDEQLDDLHEDLIEIEK